MDTGHKYIRIGEMAELNHVSTQTLRLYAKNKLLEPEYLDPLTGYRYYTLSQCAKLDLIHALKNCQLSLEQIRNIIESDNMEELEDLLGRQDGKLEEGIQKLMISRNNLRRLQKNLQVLNSLPAMGQVYLEYMEERQIDMQYTKHDFYAQGYSAYEKMIREMQDYLFENHLPPSYFANIGTIIEKEQFEKRHYTTNYAFVIVDQLYPKKEEIHTLPAGMYLALVSDDTSLELDYADLLHEEMEKMGLACIGDYICEVLSPFPLEQPGKLVYRIQIPVCKKDRL